MNARIKKLFSTKFIAAIIGALTGIVIALGADSNVITTVSGAVLSVISAVSYIVTEGRIDAAAVKTAAEKVQDALEAVTSHD